MPANLAGMTRSIARFALFALIATAANAQQPPDPTPNPDPRGLPDPRALPDDPHGLPDPHEGLVRPPDELPKISRDRYRNLDFLFGALKAAPDEASAKAVEDRIWAVWTAAGNETAILLMGRAKKAVDDAGKETNEDEKTKDYDLALRLLDAVIEIKPDYTEAWNRRATVYFMKKDYADSLSDLFKVLAREPRHFGALSGLGLIMQDIGDDKRALDAYSKALDLYPHLKGMQEKVKALKEKVEGRNI
jgi:tetratricopeptide (TPR) repeat protein